ncbi:ABC transporter permease [Georgenia muralis]|uniref:ABC-2 type transport system permease protein n=1 Tax=Georgenia muralis TaxID=154117 RepID=A0A3N4ZC61_9MICO|nr:ABC transporter permease [Georgenia muralis]RPF28890.1 ABC-2 type transport system permease protein [Georgenia muralis]
MFGLTNASAVLPGGTSVGLAMLVSMSAYGVVSLAIFTFGEDVAKERGRGWTRTLRATPFPTSVHLAAKVADALVLAVVIVAAMSVLAATAAGVSMPATRWLALGATMANLVFLPLSFASGFFVPLSDLPEVLRDVAAFLPTFHFGRLAYGVAMPAADVEAWTAAAGRPVWVHLAWVLGSAVALGALALWAARRESVTRRG